MLMPLERYGEVRERLIVLYDICFLRLYDVWIAPEKLLSLDQVRSRPTYHKEGFSNDEDFYTTQQKRRYKIPQIFDLLTNIESVHDFGFEKPGKTIVEIYDSIQEFIGLWCEIARNAPECKRPDFSELRKLENLAFILFNEYKKIKPFKKRELNKQRYSQDEELNGKGLAGFAALFSSNSAVNTHRIDDLSFFSHLDAFEPASGVIGAPMYNPQPFNYEMQQQMYNPHYIQQSQDSLFQVEQQHASNPNWIFTAG